MLVGRCEIGSATIRLSFECAPSDSSQALCAQQLIRSPKPRGTLSPPHVVLNRAAPTACLGEIPVSIELTFPMSLMPSPVCRKSLMPFGHLKHLERDPDAFDPAKT